MTSRTYSLIALNIFGIFSAYAMENNNFEGPTTKTTRVVAFPKTNNLDLSNELLTVESTYELENNPSYAASVIKALKETKVNYITTTELVEDTPSPKKSIILILKALEDVIGQQAEQEAAPKIREEQHKKTLANLSFHRRHAGKLCLITLLGGVAAGLSVPFWLPEALKKLDNNI